MTDYSVSGKIDLLTEQVKRIADLLEAQAVEREESASAIMDALAEQRELRDAYESEKRKLRPGDLNALMKLKIKYHHKGMDIL